MLGGQNKMPAAHISEVQDHSIEGVSSDMAEAKGGEREGKPRHSRIFRVVSGG